MALASFRGDDEDGAENPWAHIVGFRRGNSFMKDPLCTALEKLNSDVRNYLTPILVYSEMLRRKAPDGDREKLFKISDCAEKILASLEEFVSHMNSPPM